MSAHDEVNESPGKPDSRENLFDPAMDNAGESMLNVPKHGARYVLATSQGENPGFGVNVDNVGSRLSSSKSPPLSRVDKFRDMGADKMSMSTIDGVGICITKPDGTHTFGISVPSSGGEVILRDADIKELIEVGSRYTTITEKIAHVSEGDETPRSGVKPISV